ncbi:FAD-dependent oxidoreductase [Sphingosinicella sp. BN140058]|uniref:FAD-dependent oxidoreductase n=1 Tax=Sphingosinicella sp. BN140058 TaxID=1892855 RepID=UPI001012D3D5|nr:GMC family oxidoreductase [Sphingosinicella sp. BN140058]QAY76470.1 GMC family oxidoreductase [Sphingosinicella sp. BN140058]
MRIDLNDIGGRDCNAEICIVGAGAAGITAARRLLALGHDVMLLESGGVDHDAAVAALNDGPNVGLDYYPLRDARLRFFGGTTAIWGGRCAELDPIDLEKRDWVDGSGWPIAWDDLQAHYRCARPLFGLPPRTPEIGDFRAAGLAVPDFDPARLHTPLWSFDTRFNRFTLPSCEDLVRHPRCTIITNATVTEILAHGDGAHVESVAVRSLRGASLTIRPRELILAAGGIENARILLASRSVMPDGLGNAHDLVGRYFMEHPHARGGRVITRDGWDLLKLFGRRHRIAGHDLAALITPSAALQREKGILNTSLTIAARQPADASQALGMRVYSGLKHEIAPTRAGRLLWMGTKKIATWAQRHIDPLRPWLLHKAHRAELALLVRGEQAPNRDSRVTLTGEVDALGVPRVALDWRLSEIDKRSVATLVETLGAELRRLGLGDVRAESWLKVPEQMWRVDPLVSAHPIGGYHHIGTTRMADDPRKGVTDAYGRVHGIDNLHVVGSSTFPTASWANPTLTIVALALRTADRISAATARTAPQWEQKQVA